MVDVRTAREEDGASLAAIDAATWSSDVSPAPVRPGVAFFSERLHPDDVLVAEVAGAIAGYVSLGQSIPLPSHEHVLDVTGLAVAPDHRGRGIGRELMEAALREARARGGRKLSLRVLAPNATARRLYESCGFVVEGVLRDEFILDGRAVDDVLMAHHLG